MNLSGILNLFGHSVYDPQVETLLKQCNASCPDKGQLKRYDSIISESLGLDFWFWWKGYYREQIGEPKGTVPSNREEVVLYEVRITPEGLAKASLPFGLSFPATPDSVINSLGRKPFSKARNFAREPFWTYYEDKFELLVIFNADGREVRCFKIIALKRKDRQKIDLLENLKVQKKNILPERIPEIEALLGQIPTVAWKKRMKAGDGNFSAEAIRAARQVFEAFITSVCKATKLKNAKSIYTAVTLATKALNKVARKHAGLIETMEREEIVDFFTRTVLLTGFQIDPSFDLTEENRAW